MVQAVYTFGQSVAANMELEVRGSVVFLRERFEDAAKAALEDSSMNEEPSVQRRLVAILAADIAGYSRLMGEDDAATVRDLKGH